MLIRRPQKRYARLLRKGIARELDLLTEVFVAGYVFQIVLAICLVSGTWWASHVALTSKAEIQQPPVRPVIASIEADALELRTGDNFWGLHLDGVVPCSSMLVKGGGHMVTLSVRSDHEMHCFYHVVKESRIELNGNKFRLRVIANDQIRVERVSASEGVPIISGE